MYVLDIFLKWCHKNLCWGFFTPRRRVANIWVWASTCDIPFRQNILYKPNNTHSPFLLQHITFLPEWSGETTHMGWKSQSVTFALCSVPASASCLLDSWSSWCMRGTCSNGSRSASNKAVYTGRHSAGVWHAFLVTVDKGQLGNSWGFGIEKAMYQNLSLPSQVSSLIKLIPSTLCQFIAVGPQCFILCDC